MPVSPDISVFGKNQGFSDYQRANEEFAQRKALQQAQMQLYGARAVGAARGGNKPAALQIADALAAARGDGLPASETDIMVAGKLADKGIGIGPDGRFVQLDGYGQAAGSIEAAKAGAKQQAEKNVDLSMNPKIKGAENRAGEIGTAEGKNQGTKEKSFANYPETKALLEDTNTLLDSATGSGAGALYDATAGFFGGTTKGAEATGKLKINAGKLVMSVPRMEGPQSDRDTQLYKESAGNLADNTLPVPIRKAALAQMIKLNEQYAPREDLGGEDYLSQIINAQQGQPVTLTQGGAPVNDAPKITGSSPIIKSQAQFDALPSGAAYIEIGDDGKPMKMRKP